MQSSNLSSSSSSGAENGFLPENEQSATTSSPRSSTPVTRNPRTIQSDEYGSASTNINNSYNVSNTIPFVRTLPATRPMNDSHTNATNAANGGSLKVVVLSVYDLATREPPSYVSLQVDNGPGGSTGPPIQRHKDRNSFKFGPLSPSRNNNGNRSVQSNDNGSVASGTSSVPVTGPGTSNEVSIIAPLRELYQGTLRVMLVYTNRPSQNLVAEYVLENLNIGEPMWLILNFEPSITRSSTDSASSSGYFDSQTNENLLTSAAGATTNSSTFFIPPPTIRVQMTLTGPFRPEIATLVNLSNLWFRFMDQLESFFTSAFKNDALLMRSGTVVGHQLISGFSSIFSLDIKFLLIPIVPIVALLLVALPIVVGIAVVTLPILLPLITLIGIGVFAAAISASIIYFSASSGREVVGNTIVRPMITTLLSSKSGQKLVYDTGPRPTPINVARVLLPSDDNMWGRLLVSLVIDFVGSTSYLIPVLGELTDVVWAPLQTIVVTAMYDTTSPNLKYVSFVEEILPFTDIVPTATAGWLKQYGLPFLLGNGLKSTENTKDVFTSGTITASQSKVHQQ